MNPIPAIHSLLDPQHIAILVSEQYGLSVSGCQLIKSGMNQTYRIITPTQTFILRIYTLNWRPEAEILAELQLLTDLLQAGIQVSAPQQNLAGQLLCTLQAPEGQRYAALFSYAPGDKIRQITTAHCEQIGRQMAAMHRFTQGRSVQRVDYHTSSLLTEPYAYARAFFSETHEEMQYIHQACARLSVLFADPEFQALPRGVVHMDLWYDNMNIDPQAGITFFDFDFCGNGWLVLDVAYSLAQLFHTEPDKSVYEIRKAHFLAGYESLLLLSDAERALIPWLGMAIWIFYLGVQSQTYHTYSNVFFSDNYLARFMGMAKSWLEYHQIEL